MHQNSCTMCTFLNYNLHSYFLLLLKVTGMYVNKNELLTYYTSAN